MQRGLGLRIVTLAATILAVFGLVLTGLSWLSTRHELERALHLRGMALAKNLASNAAFALRLKDSEGVETMLQPVLEDDDTIYVAVHDADGGVVGSRGKEGIKAPTTQVKDPDHPRVDSLPGGVDEVIVPVRAMTLGADDDQKDAQLGFVRLRVSRASLEVRLRTYLLGCALVLIFGVMIAVFALNAMVRKIVLPVSNMATAAEGIAAGNLKTRVDEAGEGEVASLAKAFAAMAKSLARTISDFRSLAKNTREISDDIRAQTGEVISAAQSQVNDTDAAVRLVSTIQQSSNGVTQSVGRLAAAADVTQTSLDRMRDQLKGVATSARNLSEQADRATSGVSDMAKSIQRVGRDIGTLAGAADQTISSSQQIAQAVKHVEERAREATKLSEHVADEAKRRGGAAAEKNLAGMEKIKETVSSATKAMRALDERAEQIGAVLTVINEVNEQVSLLALNAAIIAAQAGEHGRGFSVVADEIKALAGRTSASTDEIAGQIAGIQKDSREALRTIALGEESVAAGVELAAETREVLAAILAQSLESAKTARAIEASTTQQAQGINQIANAMEQIGVMVDNVTAQSKEQTSAAERTRTSAEDMRAAATEAQRLVDALATGASQIAGAVGEVREMVEDILQATATQERGSDELSRKISGIREAAAQSLGAIERMSGGVSELTKRTEALQGSIKHFEV